MSEPHPITVLLVDDQPIIGESMRQMLRTEPEITLHFCQDARQVLSVAQQVAPTVILQDLVMPHVDGLALVRALRASPVTKHVPLIVLSIQEEPELKAECFRLGANDYLVKLPSAIELVARLRYHSAAYVNACQTRLAYEALRESREQLRLRNDEIRRQRDILAKQAVELEQRMSELAERTAELRKANELLELLARTDQLTQLLNRRAFLEKVNDEVERCRRTGRLFSIVLSDIDHFKRYNDTYGHACGDEVLRKVAAVLRSAVRKQDVVARWGGEEFILLLPETEPDGAAVLAEKIRGCLAELCLDYGSTAVRVSMTFGICEFRMPLVFDECVARADAALYEGKAAGRDRVVVWSQSRD